MAKTLAEVMSADPVICGPADTLQDAARLMRDRNIGDVVIVDSGGVRGIVTDRDLVVRALAAGYDPTTHLRDVCSQPVITLESTAPVVDAAELMRKEAVRRVPIIEGPQLVGIVSIGDLTRSEDPTSTLADISAAPPNG